MFKNNPPIIIFLFCPKWHFVKQVLFIFAQLPPNLVDIFSCPYHCSVPNFKLICLVIIFQQFSKVSVQKGTLWRKYILGMSKWDETWSHPSFDQIMSLYQIRAHGDHLCELSSKSWFLVKFSLCEATLFYLASFELPIYQAILTSTSTHYTKLWLNPVIHLPSVNSQRFCPEWSFVKQVPLW